MAAGIINFQRREMTGPAQTLSTVVTLGCHLLGSVHVSCSVGSHCYEPWTLANVSWSHGGQHPWIGCTINIDNFMVLLCATCFNHLNVGIISWAVSFSEANYCPLLITWPAQAIRKFGSFQGRARANACWSSVTRRWYLHSRPPGSRTGLQGLATTNYGLQNLGNTSWAFAYLHSRNDPVLEYSFD